MIWGVIVGTYSSIFIAAPVLVMLGTKRDLPLADSKAAVKRK
jgi:preprotein translocase subunit SecF